MTNIAIQAEEVKGTRVAAYKQRGNSRRSYTVSDVGNTRLKSCVRLFVAVIVHRDYSLTGKDVKVAVYDDMIEITSPGLLPPSIDYSAMESRQSDARNKVIAPIFKLGWELSTNGATG